MKRPNKVKTIHPFPACASMLQLLRQEAAIFFANPGLVEFIREVTSAEREQGCNHSHALVTLHADGIGHHYGDLTPFSQILGPKPTQ